MLSRWANERIGRSKCGANPWISGGGTTPTADDTQKQIKMETKRAWTVMWWCNVECEHERQRPTTPTSNKYFNDLLIEFKRDLFMYECNSRVPGRCVPQSRRHRRFTDSDERKESQPGQIVIRKGIRTRLLSPSRYSRVRPALNDARSQFRTEILINSGKKWPIRSFVDSVTRIKFNVLFILLALCALCAFSLSSLNLITHDGRVGTRRERKTKREKQIEIKKANDIVRTAVAAA